MRCRIFYPVAPPGPPTSLARPPTLSYEYTDLDSLAAFARRGWFDVVLVSVWFWHDPAPSFAEVVLPMLRPDLNEYIARQLRNATMEAQRTKAGDGSAEDGEKKATSS